MYVATIPNRKSPPAILLREGYREGVKVKTRTLLNITHWSPERIEAMKRLLKGEFDDAAGLEDPTSGPIFGVLFALKEIAERIGITKALGRHPKARLALFLILARVAHQGSRLSAVRWCMDHATSEILGLPEFDEDDLYEALDWLAQQQDKIEDRLFLTYLKKNGVSPALVLYDVTSSYFEGLCNELGEFGYNRDGKKGKKQIVIGLLAGPDGEPLSVRVFRGNTADPSTVATQVETLRDRFGISEVIFVGDRGMVKSKGKKVLTENDFRYITALTNAQAKKLLKKQVLQMSLFDEQACEVSHGNLRLILRRNPVTARKEAHRRADKLAKLEHLVSERNRFVAGSRRAKPEAGQGKFQRWARRKKISSFVEIVLKDRMLSLEIDEEAKAQASLLDGCYVLETNVAEKLMNASTIDERYRDLQKVERNFRNMKTGLLEVRPIFVRKESRTVGHVFCSMLALKIIREMNALLKASFGTVAQGEPALTIEDALACLSRLCLQIHHISGVDVPKLPRPDARQETIFKALAVPLPRVARKTDRLRRRQRSNRPAS